MGSGVSSVVQNQVPTPTRCAAWRCNRVELGVIITAVALAILGVGLSATTAHSVAYASLGGAAILILGEIVYRIIKCIRPNKPAAPPTIENPHTVASELTDRNDEDWFWLPPNHYPKPDDASGRGWFG